MVEDIKEEVEEEEVVVEEDIRRSIKIMKVDMGEGTDKSRMSLHTCISTIIASVPNTQKSQ